MPLVEAPTRLDSETVGCPFPAITEVLSTGQHRIGEVEEEYPQDYFNMRLMRLIRSGEVEIFPVGDHTIVRLADDH